MRLFDRDGDYRDLLEIFRRRSASGIDAVFCLLFDAKPLPLCTAAV
jgi:hypothetical protein